ncbi:cytochrome P450 [Streptomyces sparsogenes]|uniref:Cytochrome P450 n=2 Tax=Streptomyces sparsogenes TaxID=67365 RepID=A0A1R1SAV7_9ACTN|nr:cytochrome P450 [Streptomyces sparsogenes]AKG47577.1 SpsI [Streptomyces sparsogenes]OMI35308.1 cytochrome P450 [Streptomyces sparsogenes DSM 40356]
MSLDLTAIDDFSHNNVQYIEDPFSFYALMREHSPAHLSGTIFGGTWLMFRYADCARLMKDERLSNARSAVPLRFLDPEQRAEFADMLDIYGRWLAFHDGKEHTRNRRQANRGYVPFTDEYLEPRIQGIVDGLLDRVDPTGFDLIADVAFPLPAMVIADVLGVPVEAHPQLNRWTDDIAHLFGSTSVSVEHLRRTRKSTRELAAFLASEDNARRSRDAGGLLHRLRETEVHGYRFSERDVVAQAALLLFAGVASIRYLIGNSVRALADVPATQRDLLLHPDTVGPAVEELLRVCTPVSFVGRVAAEDFDYTASDGTVVPLRKGQPLLLYVASANRDPEVFEHPDELVLDRPLPNRHLTFGIGRHLCFGDPLVRQTTRIALSTLYRRWPALHVPPQATDWNNNLGFHGFTSLWVTGGV